MKHVDVHVRAEADEKMTRKVDQKGAWIPSVSPFSVKSDDGPIGKGEPPIVTPKPVVGAA